MPLGAGEPTENRLRSRAAHVSFFRWKIGTDRTVSPVHEVGVHLLGQLTGEVADVFFESRQKSADERPSRVVLGETLNEKSLAWVDFGFLALWASKTHGRDFIMIWACWPGTFLCGPYSTSA